MSAASYKSPFGLFRRLLGLTRLEEQKLQMEALLKAAPGAWCGWRKDGSIIYSDSFPGLLGIDTISGLTDIQDQLSASDAAILEGLFSQLQQQGKAFDITVRSADTTHIYTLSARRIGLDKRPDEYCDIFWLEDITATHKAIAEAKDKGREAETEAARLESALNQTPFPIWIRDADTKIIWTNRVYAAILDVTPATVIAEQKELPAKPLRKSGHKNPGKALAQQALDENKGQEMVAHTILGGSRRLLSITETPLPGGNRTLGVARDITREEELESEQKRYMSANQELLEQLGTAIGIFDAGQKLEFFNSAFVQLWGLEEKYLRTLPKLGDIMEKLREIRRLPEQADFRRFKKSWLDMFTGLLAPHEDMLYLPDGRALRMLVVPHPMGGLMMTFEDVTDRLELESSYNTLIAVQKETIDNLAEGLVAFGGDGRLKLWNPAFARLWGLNPEDLDGEHHISQLAEKMRKSFAPEEWEEAKQKLMSQAIDRRMQQDRMRLEDGRLVSCSTVPLPDGGMLVTHIDISSSVKVENALREKNAALEAAERLKLDFLANVSYQLRTPLNAIMGFTEILNNEYFGPLNDRQREYTAGMSQAGGRLLALIDDILDLSTIEAGYLDLNRDLVAVRDILENIQNLTTEWARKEKVTVKLQCPDNIGTFSVDQRRMRQVLLNLVRNAISHTPEGGTITLKADRTKNHVILTVADTGAGIPKTEQERIFEPFERLPGNRQTANNTERGAGLGLTLVKNIVTLHQGTVAVQSAVGKGSEFTIEIPTDTAAPAAKDQKQPAEKTPPKTKAQNKTKTKDKAQT